MCAVNIVKVIFGNYQCTFRTLLACSTVIVFGFLSYMFELNKCRCRAHSSSDVSQV